MSAPASHPAIMNTTKEPLMSLHLPDPMGTVVGSGYIAYLMAVVFLASALAVLYRDRKPEMDRMYPVVNTTKEEYFANGRGMVQRGKDMYGDSPFRVYTGMGSVLILPPKYASEIKNDNRFDASKFLLQYWQAGIPGFEPYIALGSELLHDVIKLNLTQSSMAKMAADLSQEAAAALEEILTDNEEWHEIDLNMTMLRITSQVSSLIFLGPELCRNPKWLDITVSYTAKATGAARVLRQYPRFMHKIVHWFLKDCQDLRRMVNEARQTVAPILQKRREQKQAQNSASAEFNDSLQWYEDLANKRGISYDAATQQIGLSIGAILTSTDLVSQAMMDLSRNPESIEPLKQEIRRVVGDGDFNPTTLHNLKLLDSALKETLRIKPVAVVGLGRRVTDSVKLSTGAVLPKDSGIAVSAERMWDEKIYQEPLKYDIYRFLRMRESACGDGNAREEAAAQLVSTSEDHFGFGLGSHQCPGRFFGANTVKLVMTHLLMKYEFKPSDGTVVEPLKFGFSMLANPSTKMMVRRSRKEGGW